MLSRRRFIQAASGLFLAPAIVRAESLMPVVPVKKLILTADSYIEAAAMRMALVREMIARSILKGSTHHPDYSMLPEIQVIGSDPWN